MADKPNIDQSIPIFWTVAANLMVNINHIAWLSFNPATGSAVIGLSVPLPDGKSTVKVDAGRQLTELMLLIGTRADVRGKVD